MIHFIAHGKEDNVGVAVVECEANQKVTGWNMETDDTLEAVATQEVPLGHKIALARIGSGEKVIKYNVPVGNATQDITPGQHVHTHNLKTARW
jgi:(2R)-sulfolactate sulfo-lyase subunit alpha